MMANILLHRLPKSVQVSGSEYPVNWGYRANILIEIVMFSTSRSDEQKLLDALNIFYLKNIPPDMEAAIKQMICFFHCGKEIKSENGVSFRRQQRSYDFEMDAPLIYAAFRAQYGVNLNRTLNNELHWWEFSAMFDSLNENLKMSRIMYYRTADLEGMSKNQKKFIKKMRALYAIPSGDETLSDKARLAKRNADMKAYVRKRLLECEKKKE